MKQKSESYNVFGDILVVDTDEMIASRGFLDQIGQIIDRLEDILKGDKDE